MSPRLASALRRLAGRTVLGLGLLLAPAGAQAEPSGPPSGGGFLQPPSALTLKQDLPGADPWRMLGSLAVVLGLVAGVSAAARRVLGAGLGAGRPGARLRLLQSLPLGGRRFLSLVEVDGQPLRLGVSKDRIELLHVVEAEGRFHMPEAFEAEVESP